MSIKCKKTLKNYIRRIGEIHIYYKVKNAIYIKEESLYNKMYNNRFVGDEKHEEKVN